MLTGLGVISIFCLYMGLLFWLALKAERMSAAGHSLVNNPHIYALSMGVYCSSWTYYGSVGLAANHGMLFLAIYLGPTLAAVFFPSVLRRMVRLKTSRRITSIADFICARYEKSEPLAALVTVIALVGTMPYVALQIKAFLATFAIIATPTAGEPGWVATHAGPVMVGLMIVFTIAFGVRRLDPTERHEGMVMAVAAESVVKLIAFMVAGLFVVYFLFDGLDDIFGRIAASPELSHLAERQGESFSFLTWGAYLVLAANAIFLLPRQFHIAVVENQSERHIRKAMWLLPLYLFLINLFVYPVAMAGLLKGYPLARADTFVLLLPQGQGSPALALLVFIGGFSAATGMILICSMAMATMISNHLLLPLVDWFPQLRFLERHLLRARWLAVGGFILMGYLFERLVGERFMLANIGMISFAAILQLAPATFGGLFWRDGNRRGAIWGLSGGFLVWAYTLLLPVFVRGGMLEPGVMVHGPLGLEFLRPHALFGTGGLDPVTHCVFWSLCVNLGLYVMGSLWEQPSQESQSHAQAFVEVMSGGSLFAGFGRSKPHIPLSDKRRAIEKLLTRYFGTQKAAALTAQAFTQVGLSGRKLASITKLAELYDEVERILGGSIGAATSHRVLSRADLFTPFEAQELRDLYAEILANLRARPEDLKRRIDFYQEREALIKVHAQELEEKVAELERQMLMRREAEDRLRESEERYRMAIEYSSDGVALIKDRRILFINKKLAEIFGYGHRGDLVGRSLGVIVHPEERERVLTISRLRQHGLPAPTRYDFKGLRRDGTQLYIAVSATTINYHGETMNLVYLRDVTARRRAEEEIHHLSRRLIAGIEEERRRLAADLHDEFGQALTALHLRVASLNDGLPPGMDEPRAACGKLIGMIESLAENLRNICSELRPDMLDHLGLVPTVQWYVEDFRERLQETRVELEAVGFGGDKRMDQRVDIALYRILQEALNNVAKHADAGKVRVILTYSHPHVIMVISDDGRGMDYPREAGSGEGGRGGIGLVSMKERVAAVGGTLDIRSSPGRGTTIRVSLPAAGPEKEPGATSERRAAGAGGRT